VKLGGFYAYEEVKGFVVSYTPGYLPKSRSRREILSARKTVWLKLSRKKAINWQR